MRTHSRHRFDRRPGARRPRIAFSGVFVVPPPELVDVCLGGLLGAIGGDELTAPQRTLLDTIAADVFGTAVDVAALPPSEPAELAASITDPKLRRQLAHAMVVLELLRDPPTGDQQTRVDRYAAALDVSGARLRVVRDRISEQRRRMLLDRARLDRHLERPVSRSSETDDQRLAARWRRLEHLPPGSLGRWVWEFYCVHGWDLPGERHGVPASTARHDFVHVLADYDATPLGEVEVAGFIAAGKGDDLGFALLLVALVVSDPDVLDVPGGSERLTDALGRGTRCGIDLLDAFDHFALAAEQVEALRVRFRVPPKSTTSEGAARLGDGAEAETG